MLCRNTNKTRSIVIGRRTVPVGGTFGSAEVPKRWLDAKIAAGEVTPINSPAPAPAPSSSSSSSSADELLEALAELQAMTAREAIEAAGSIGEGATGDPRAFELLEAWLRAEDRVTVQAAIQRRLDKLLEA